MIKKLKKIIILVVIFSAGFAAGNAVKYYLDYWRADRNVKAFLNALEAPYKNDQYGGKTPEETFDLYLAALKKGDLELASRYSIVNKQRQKLEFLKEKKANGELNSYIEKLGTTRKTWVKKQNEIYNWQEKAAYEYMGRLEKDIVDNSLGIEIKFEAGEYKSLVEFVKHNDIWKLIY